jgi:hypothetical protein
MENQSDYWKVDWMVDSMAVQSVDPLGMKKGANSVERRDNETVVRLGGWSGDLKAGKRVDLSAGNWAVRSVDWKDEMRAEKKVERKGVPSVVSLAVMSESQSVEKMAGPLVEQSVDRLGNGMVGNSVE